MAKRPTRLAPLTDRTADRRRQQLDDAVASGPASEEQRAAEGTDFGPLGQGGRRGSGTGLEGAPDVDAAVAERVAGRPAAGITLGTEEVSAREPSGVDDDDETDGRIPGSELGGVGTNPIAGVGEAPASALADPSTSGLRGTGSLTTPAAEGVQAGPSVADGVAGANFRFNVQTFEKATEDPDGPSALPDGTVVFEGPGGRSARTNSFVFQNEGTTTAGLVVDGAFAAVQVDDTGQEVASAAANAAAPRSPRPPSIRPRGTPRPRPRPRRPRRPRRHRPPPRLPAQRSHGRTVASRPVRG